jgi:2-methylisocitrate lyase-like PEP mutase family enzyme
MRQSERAAHFRGLHDRRPLVLPNAWDAASARVIELAGAPAIATTSAGVSWGLGCSDGQKLGRQEMIEVIRRLVGAVSVPVTADVESGYGSGSAYDVGETVRAVIDAGAVGINLEDSPGVDGAVLLTPARQAERIRAGRAAARIANVDLFINARTDVYLMKAGAPEGRFDETVTRARAYRDAGTDCLFVPGIIEQDTIAALVAAIDLPLNIMAGPGAPSIRELGQLGVARVSVGPAITQTALAATRRAALELLECGTYGALADAVPFGEANRMFLSQ